MTHTQAWMWVVSNWGVSTWTRLPRSVSSAANLRSDLGVCHGMILTRIAAEGSNEFISRMQMIASGKKP